MPVFDADMALLFVANADTVIPDVTELKEDIEPTALSDGVALRVSDALAESVTDELVVTVLQELAVAVIDGVTVEEEELDDDIDAEPVAVGMNVDTEDTDAVVVGVELLVGETLVKADKLPRTTVVDGVDDVDVETVLVGIGVKDAVVTDVKVTVMCADADRVKIKVGENVVDMLTVRVSALDCDTEPDMCDVDVIEEDPDIETDADMLEDINDDDDIEGL